LAEPHLYDRTRDYAELYRRNLVIDETFQLTLPTVVETGAYRSDLDFTMPLFYMDDGLLMRPGTMQTEFATQPFTPTVWMCFLFVFLFCAVLDSFYRVVMRGRGVHPSARFMRAMRRQLLPNNKSGGGNAAWLTNFAIFTQRSIDVNVSSHAHTNMKCTWWISR
jgi:hypothetical protein